MMTFDVTVDHGGVATTLIGEGVQFVNGHVAILWYNINRVEKYKSLAKLAKKEADISLRWHDLERG